MTLPALVDNVGMTVLSAPGTGEVALGAAIGSPADGYYQSFDDAGAPNGAAFVVRFEDGADWEESAVTYASAGPSLTDRTLVKSSTGDLLDLSADARVFAVLSKSYFDALEVLVAGKLDASAVDTDDALAANSDDKVPSQKALVSYIAAQITAAVAALLNGAPGALDTLKELADALGDDADFAASVTTALAGKVATTRTVNGHPLSADVTVSRGDLSLDTTDSPQFAGVNVGHASDTTVTRPAAGKLAVEGHTLLSGDEAGQAVSGGAEITPKDLGTKTSGTLTVNAADCPWQKAVHGAGAFSLDVSAHVNQCILELTNSSASGSITTSAFDLVDGDAFDNTAGSCFLCLIAYTAAGKKSLSVRKVT